jgi:uncharacterized membrane protein
MRLDEEPAGAVLGLLDEDPARPSTVDVRRAIAEGRRRRCVRRVGGYAVAAGVTGLMLMGTSLAVVTWDGSAPDTTGAPETSNGPAAEVAPPAPTTCAIRELTTPDGRKMALVTGGDPSGRFLLGRTYPAQGSADDGMGLHVVVWDKLQPTLVTVPGDDQSLQDINSSGTGIGISFTDSGVTSWLYRGGAVTRLPDGDKAQVAAINEAGIAVGSLGDSPTVGKPVIWRSVDQAPKELPLPAGTSTGRASDIDEDGTIIGAVGNGLADMRAYVWSPDGVGRELPVPADLAATASEEAASEQANSGKGPGKRGLVPDAGKVPLTMAYNIRNSWVSGRIRAVAVRWNLRTGDVSRYPDLDGYAGAVNRHSWQIGIDAQGRAVFRPDRGPVVLPELASHSPGGLQNIPTTLSDDATVIGGQSDDKDGVIHAVVWTCS